MDFVRHYSMTAKNGSGHELEAALHALADKVARLDGCEGVDFYKDLNKPERFTFLEHWTSVEAHRSGGEALGREAFAPMMALLAQPPEIASLRPLTPA